MKSHSHPYLYPFLYPHAKAQKKRRPATSRHLERGGSGAGVRP